MKHLKLIALVAMALFTFSCNDEKDKSGKIQDLKQEEPNFEKIATNKETNESEYRFLTDSTDKPQPPHEEKKEKQTQTSPKANPDWDKKIIKTAFLSLEVKNYNSFYSTMREKVKILGGYIAQEEQTQSEYKIENTLSIKVPVDQFDNALTQLTSNVEKINEKKITSQDVTTEFVDTKSRMESKKQVRQRYLDLLKQAKNMEEILNVQSEINGIQEEIEAAAGRFEYLGHSSTYSTIDLTYYQVLNSSAKDNDKPSFATKLSNAFKNGWNWVGEIFVGLISIWPLLLLVFIGIIFYKRIRVSKPKQA